MKINSAEFIASNTDYRKCPKPDKPEFAFIGRSNVGKSSLINMLVNRRGLAKTSASPGKTQTINHFLINKSWYLVDLPGYGFARTSQSLRQKWIKMTEQYLLNRENLMLLFVLVDARIDPQKSDIDFINKLGEHRIPAAILFTKTDQLTKSKITRQVEQFNNELLKSWQSLPPEFITSAVKGTGKEELLNYLDNLVAEKK